MRTAKNILLHELIGLRCEVVNSRNRNQIGLGGRIVDETIKTIVINEKGTDRRIFKQGSIFRVSLNRENVDIDGDYLVARPEDRIRKKVKKW